MILGIISDTHDREATVAKAFGLFSKHNVQQIIHCGDFKSPEALAHCLQLAQKHDIPFLGVLGNNDTEVQSFLSQSTKVSEGVVTRIFEGRSVAIYHGHHAPTLREVRANKEYDIVLLGHTHKPKIEEEPGRLIVNPGSTAFSIPRSKLFQPTVAIVNTQSLEASILAVPMCEE